MWHGWGGRGPGGGSVKTNLFMSLSMTMNMSTCMKLQGCSKNPNHSLGYRVASEDRAMHAVRAYLIWCSLEGR